MTLKDLLGIVKSQLKDLTTVHNPDFRLEQAEYKKDEGVWDIVVSYLVENTNKRLNPITSLTSEFQYHRMYKRLKVNDNKEIVGFYIYDSKE
jgi:hypothetical protein